MKQNIIIGALLLILGLVLGLFICRSCSTPEKVEIVQIDSVVVRDTVREYYPVERERKVVDTMRIVVRDTVRIADTLYINLPLEVKLYFTDEYYAEVSGYRPSLDCIEVYPKTTIITQSVSKATTKNTLSIGMETSYLNTVSIPIYLEYGRMLHKNVEIYGQAFYDLPLRQWGVGIGIKAEVEW